MAKIYHLLDESEAFSERDGGAISRWAANVLRDGSETIVCPATDSTWGFDPARVHVLPNWQKTNSIHPVLYRMPWVLQKAFYSSIFEPLFRMLKPGDILWTHNRPESAAVLALAARQKGFELVLHMHNSHLTRANKGQLAALKTATIVFCSRFLHGETEAAFPGHFPRTRVVLNGADGEKYYPAEREANAVPNIVFTGRLVPYKGVHVLIEAMRLLQKMQVEATCTIVGSSGFGNNKATGYTRKLERQRASNTTLVGYKSGSALADLLRSADIFCCPSVWHDPFPLAPIEAMACGLPVVASNTGGLPETLAFGGGRLVPSEDPQALATALAELMQSPELRRQLRQEAIEAYKGHFRWSHVREQYQTVVDGLLK